MKTIKYLLAISLISSFFYVLGVFIEGTVHFEKWNKFLKYSIVFASLFFDGLAVMAIENSTTSADLIKEAARNKKLMEKSFPNVIDQLGYFPIKKFTFENREFVFNEVIEFKVIRDNNLKQYIAENEELKIFAHGPAMKDLIEGLKFSMYANIINYVEEKDENLTKDGKELKEKLKSKLT